MEQLLVSADLRQQLSWQWSAHAFGQLGELSVKNVYMLHAQQSSEDTGDEN